MRLTFNDHEQNAFAKNGVSAENIENLMFDLVKGNKILDEDGNEVSKADADAKLRKFSLDFVGLQEGFSRRDFRDAVLDGRIRRYFRIIEEVVDNALDLGYHDSEWFNRLVDYRNIANGDAVEFVNEADDNLILNIAVVGKSHHDYILQRPNVGSTYTLPMVRYGAAVGIDLNRYFAGQEDFARLISLLTRSVMLKNQGIIFGAVSSAIAQISSLVTTPADFIGSGALNSTSKDTFDAIIDNVEAIYGNAVIIGTKTALRQITKLYPVDWATPELKTQIAGIGRLGSYEGTTLIETPQRWADKVFSAKVMDDKKLYILPSDDFKLIDFVTRGETELDEITQKGEAAGRIDDIGKYEVQYEQGIGVKANKVFGVWTLP